jgi:hypothetical protein
MYWIRGRGTRNIYVLRSWATDGQLSRVFRYAETSWNVTWRVDALTMSASLASKVADMSPSPVFMSNLLEADTHVRRFLSRELLSRNRITDHCYPQIRRCYIGRKLGVVRGWVA